MKVETNVKRLIAIVTLTALGFTASNALSNEYTIVDTGQSSCYDNTKAISCPESEGPFDGQDAQYQGKQPSYLDNGDGTISDLNTGLMWQQTPEKSKSTFSAAKHDADSFKLAGNDDWRLPTIKELYSLIDFRGNTGTTESTSIPYINTDYFDFYYGDTSNGDRIIDAQFWSATEYTGTTMNGNATAFGVNFADGRIKGYPTQIKGRGKQGKRYVRYVRGNTEYGINDFADNNNGTITDQATGLTWMQKDSGKAMNWSQALSYAENTSYAGHDDWRLPNAKELQSLVDYSKSPQATNQANRGDSIDPLFSMTDPDAWYWTSTTHMEHGRVTRAAYLCFGQAWGYMSFRGSTKQKMDVHGSGAQRSDPKSGNPDNYPQGLGPQGDEIRINNFVRLVRGGETVKTNKNVSMSTGDYPGEVVVSKKNGPTQAPPSSTTKRPNSMGSFSGPQQGGQSNQMGPPDQMGGSGEQAPAGNPGDFTKRFDVDGNGKISKSEFPGPPEHFTMFDKNMDGYISEDEAPKGPPPKRRQ